MVVARALPVPFGATWKKTRSSPLRGIDVVTVTHNAEDTALQTHASWSGPPHAGFVGLAKTSKLKSPPAAGTSKLDGVVRYVQPS
jgi:hypothetical protein